MAERLCPWCLRWLCAEDDAFCGACGKPCAQLKVELFPSILLAGHHAPDVIVKLANPTCGWLTVSPAKAPALLDWVKAPGGKVGPGETVAFRARALSRKLKTPVSNEVLIETNAGKASATLMAIAEAPQIHLNPAEVDFWSDGRAGTERLDFEAYPEAGDLRVNSVHPPPGKSWLKFGQVAEQPVVASARTPFTFTVRIVQSEVPEVFRGAGTQETFLMGIGFEDIHGPKYQTLEVKLNLRDRPELLWTGEANQVKGPAQLYQMSKQKLSLKFANPGRTNAALRIEDVDLIAPAGLRCDVRRQSKVPLEIKADGTATVEFELDLDYAAHDLYHFEMRVWSNGREPLRSFQLPIEVLEVGEFDGVVAIDFGSSNTCCMVLESGREPESVFLDGGSSTCPTILSYLDVKEPVPEIRTGNIIRETAAIDEVVASSKVDHLKQQLGSASSLLKLRPRNSAVWVRREARAAAADYLRHIREVAEQAKKAKFSRFVLTHPAVCSLRQYRNLRLALQEAFGASTEVEFLQEPIASLIPFFVEMAARSDLAGYTVASFDLGGGTTDITVVRVVQDREGNGIAIKPEIITSFGERFGGENLSEFLISELKERCKRLLPRKYPGYRFEDRESQGFDTPNSLQNDARFQITADDLKALWSEEKTSQPRASFSGILLHLISARNEQSSELLEFKAAEIEAEGKNDLQTAFLSEVRNGVGRLTGMLKEAVGSMRLDYIQLSGKTTFLPIVRDTIQQYFYTTEIKRAADPKECVVRGACLASDFGNRRRTRLVLPAGSRHRTTSSIGVISEDIRFEPVIRVDKPIPDDGLQPEDFPNAWSGSGPLVLWENLGFNNSLQLLDGSRNQLVDKLGSWVADVAEKPVGDWCAVRLRLSIDFQLQVFAVTPDGKAIPMRPKTGSSSRGMSGGL